MPNVSWMLRSFLSGAMALCSLPLLAATGEASCGLATPGGGMPLWAQSPTAPMRSGNGIDVPSERSGDYDPVAAATRRAEESRWFARLLAERPSLAPEPVLALAMPQAQRDAIEHEPGDGRLRVGGAVEIGQVVDFRSIGSRMGERAFANGRLRVDASGARWEIEVESPQASALRLHFTELALAPGVELFVYNDAGQVARLRLPGSDGAGTESWSDGVFGDRVRVQVRADSAAALGNSRFTLAEAMHFGSRYRIAELLRREYEAGPLPAGGFCGAPAPDCTVDAMCALSTNAGLENATRAVAHLQFIVGSGAYICTGTLLNSVFAGAQAGSGDGAGKPPYLLTANHCISSQASASTVESFFHYHTLDCFSTCAWNRVQVSGSTLLATGSAPTRPDFTLLRLSPLPAGSGVARLGWTTEVAQEGWYVLRLSHPEGSPLAYSYRRLRLGNPALPHCAAAPEPTFLYSGLAPTPDEAAGAVASGSSGSPGLIFTDDYSDVQVIGQLYGHCPAGGDVCDPDADSTVDGSFRMTFPYVERFLVERIFANGFE